MTPTFSSSRLSARPITPLGNSTSSLAITFERPWMRAMPSPASTTVPTLVAVTSAPNFSICSLRIDVISSGRTAICTTPGRLAGRSREQALQRYQLAARAAVDQAVADARDQSAQDLRPLVPLHLHLLAGQLRESAGQRLPLVVAQRHRRRHGCVGDAAVLIEQLLKLLGDL